MGILVSILFFGVAFILAVRLLIILLQVELVARHSGVTCAIVPAFLLFPSPGLLVLPGAKSVVVVLLLLKIN